MMGVAKIVFQLYIVDLKSRLFPLTRGNRTQRRRVIDSRLLEGKDFEKEP